jgi:hypothetical protein
MKHPTARILWLALLASQAIHLAVAFLVKTGAGAMSSLAFSRLFFALAAVSLVTAAATILQRRHALVAPIQAGRLDPGTPEGFAKALPPYLVALALVESISIYGLVLALLAQTGWIALPFATAAFALMVVHRPTAPDLAPPAAPALHRPPPIG